MQLYPAIDIKGGQCVRLTQGLFDNVKVYSDTPADMARLWVEKGATFLHLVDLDGALAGRSINEPVIRAIAEAVDVPIQIGGGIRSREAIASMLELGVSRVIIGTKAVENPQFIRDMIEEFGPERIVVGVDAKDGMVAIEGWEKVSTMSAAELCQTMKNFGVRHIVYTDISRDGMLTGPNVAATRKLTEETGLDIIASGGVSSMDDLQDLYDQGIHGAIIGKALYERRVPLEEAVARFEKTAHKKLIPGFGICNGCAVILNDTQKVFSEDILTLSQYYSDNGADELFIHDLSQTDEDHERTIGLIKEIARAVDIPIITGGRVKRLEDIKKYLYAGARAAFLDVSIDDNVDLIKEAADRFGSEKIYAYLPDAAYTGQVMEYVQLGASMMVLDVPNLTHEQLLIMRNSSASIPFLMVCDEQESDGIASCLKASSAAGVILNIGEKSEGNCMIRKQELKNLGISVDTFESSIAWKNFKTGADGLVPVIVQDYKTAEVLMLAYMNEEAFQHTLETGRMTYFSRSRQSLWVKGETSGHFQYVRSLKLDCDNDTILAKVSQVGPACHTGARSCFFKTLAEKEYKETNPLKVFEDVFAVILDRKENPKEGSYTNYLFDKGIDKILKKLGEEATEIVIASKNPNPEEIKYEISDFLYHMMVLMAEKGITWEEITEELANR